ncbi:Transcription antitermination protein NusB [Neolewinella maritima]|uniref:Transcription antitermination protein NusB n=1 Tax=Neolewinella maritima TaxID=1383882 RepID=A0ABN8FA62_9BACT|nr:transcription antitermination factor NusB [Neolewinella maritima]CAH1002190.1 Transcription antitermination protein NusB [Neolewinella maritima]
MLSRRNVRIKIMQVLYAAQRQERHELRPIQSHYTQLVRRSFELYLLNLLILQRTCEYAKQDVATRKVKLRPTEEDLAFRATLATNPAILSLTDNKDLSRHYDRYRIRSMTDADQIKQLYRDFLGTDAYITYAAIPEPEAEDTTKVLLALYKWLQSQELFLTMVEDQFPLWQEDKSLVVGAMKKTIKALPTEEEFAKDYQSNSEAVSEFGDVLLRFVVESNDQLLTRITPVLQNWDVDRVAIIDMILLKMAMAEFLEFDTIPPQVTLNEYLDISKLYSTDKSKDFLNGVLDRVLKELQAEGLVK